MYDKILQTKKEMRNVIKENGMTRLEKYNLLKEKSRSLSDREREILIKECYRDYESCDRVEDIKELITVYLTGIGLLITLFGIFLKDKIVESVDFQSLVGIVAIAIVISIAVLSFIQSWRSKNLNITKHMLDILEEK